MKSSTVNRRWPAPILAAVLLLGLNALPAAAQKRVLDHDAYDIWKTIGGETISADGAWVLYHLAPRVGDTELVVTRRGDREHRVERAAEAQFSHGAAHAVFTIRPAYDSIRALRLDDVPEAKLPKDTLGIMALSTGEVLRVPAVRSWKLPDEAGDVVAYLLEPEEPADTSEAGPGTEEEPGAPPEPVGEPVSEEEEAGEEREKPDSYPLVLHRLDTGEAHRFEDVVWYGFSEDGSRLLYTASNDEGTADGVYLVDTATGRARTLLTGEAAYEQPVVSGDGSQVAFLTDRDDYEAEQPEFALYHWREGRGAARRLADEDADGVPAGWWISEHGELRFSESGGRLFFGTAPRPAPEPEDTLLDEEKIRLDLWHWQDPLIQPMQKLQAEEERGRSYLAVAHLDRGDRIVQLATEAMPEVEIAGEGDSRHGLAETNVPYRYLVGIESPGYSDIWIVDVRTGERRRVVTEEQVVWAGLSPDGRYAAWYDARERHWFAMDVDGDRVVNLTAEVPYPVWDEEDDRPMLPYPYGLAGWTEDGGELLVYDRYDIWAVDPRGRDAPRNVTDGYGRTRGLELRYVELDEDADGIEPTEPLFLSAFDVTTKEAGFYRDRVEGAGAPERLIQEPKWFGSVEMAEGADILLYSREDVLEYPDLWVAEVALEGPVRWDGEKVSDANPQQKDFRWATVELVEWVSNDGIPLQGLLYKPEDFDPSREYPMMVYFYERNSDNLHRHHPPLPHRSIIRPTFYASRDYIVFIPDIVYEDGYPGESAMDAVMPGTLMLAAEPWVDEDNVGIQGHSWGGYQIAYMITQTDFFKAAEAGAPVSNMTSAYGGIRWGSGLSRMFQYERTQSRIGGSLWEETERYIENSPLFFLDRVKTPLLIMHNDEDGAVPWYQGIELFVGLRRLGKPAWMVVYNEEPHWPTTDAHIRDWNIRMQQFFDHFLKGAPAPEWLAEGIPATEKGRTLGIELVEEPMESGGGDPGIRP